MTSIPTADNTAKVIDKMRAGITPSADELIIFAAGLADGQVSDAQAGAFAMSVCLQGLGPEGRTALTRGMRDSGHIMQWNLDAPTVDKHSTGGVGDTVSLILGPALAACGAYVPMISGRGLGHTGGTLDKLEAIPGVICDVPEETFRNIVADVGCAIVAASTKIAPADRRLYAIRNESRTVPNIDLITASILSKKLAAGLEALVLDVKVGSGAFMQTQDEAQALARALVDTSNAAGCATRALLSNMDEPLADSLGNALEVIDAMDCLTGEITDHPLLTLSVILGGEALALCGLCATPQEGEARIRQSIRDGRALEVFAKMIYSLGGPSDFATNYRAHLPKAPVIREVRATRAGYLCAVDGRALGEAVVDLGGGRRQATHPISFGVGLSEFVKFGRRLEESDPICLVHADTPEDAAAAEAAVLAACEFGETPPPAAPLILARVK